MGEAFDSARNIGGVFKTSYYPYTSGGTGRTCGCGFSSSQTANIGVRVSGYTSIGAGNQAAIKAAVRNVGPLAVALDASGWDSYSSGVYKNKNCNKPSNINHAVLIVGYGTDGSGQDY